MTESRANSIREIAAKDLPAAARLHASALDTGWTAEDLALAARDPAHLAWISERDDGRLAGLLIARVIAEEAEMLTLVVDPRDRRHGIARALCETLLAGVGARCVRHVFLEVAEDNLGAIALYRALGFVATGRRRGYYTRAGRTAIDAVTMTFRIAQVPAVDGLPSDS